MDIVNTALIIFLIIRTWKLQTQIDELRESLDYLEDVVKYKK